MLTSLPILGVTIRLPVNGCAYPILRLGQARCVMAGTAVPVGMHGILIIGGAAGDLFRKLDYEFPRAIASEAANKTAEVDRLQQEKLEILNNHPGFSRDVLAFNTVTQAWSVAGTIEGESPVTLAAAKIGGPNPFA